MPFSYSSQISAIVGFAERLSPRRVLDVGVGMGQYGFLLRTHLEHLNLFEIDGDRGWQRPREEWQVTIDGIEGFAGYRTPVHDWAYNRLFIGDALELLPTLPARDYDLVLAIDIVEHFTAEQGARFVAECQRVCRGALVVSTPKDFLHQEVAANPFENHRSHWSEAQLSALGFSEFLPDPQSAIAIYRA